MAVTIFSKQAGIVSTFPDPTLPANTTLRVEGWGGYAGFKSIISRVNVAAQGNFQFLHTLGGNIYVYVFGDRVGQLGVSGLAFDSTCDDAAGTIGIERVLDYYSTNRIAARRTPIKITLGVRTTLSGYLVGVSGDVVDPASRIYQFNLQFIMPPQSRIPCSTATGGPAAGGAEEEEEEPTGGTTTGGGGNPEDYPLPKGPVNADGSFSAGSTASVSSSGYSTFGTGPSVYMVKAQVN
jgi:hypothetical protein